MNPTYSDMRIDDVPYEVILILLCVKLSFQYLLQHCVLREALSKGTRLRDLKFSPEQISALLPDQRQQSKPATVRNKAQEIIESTDPIGEAFITNLLEGVNATPENVVAIDSRLKRLRHELRKKGASEEIINATLDDDITWESNKKQNADRKLHARIGISPSEHFTLRQSPDGPHSSAEHYAIINDRRKIFPSEPKDKVDTPYNDLIEELD
ncbi:9540_t:CDS:2 [Entrophospora sp. SA101]|nr:9540_t:CDS:2 [Entrophospora sp. SA101]